MVTERPPSSQTGSYVFLSRGMATWIILGSKKRVNALRFHSQRLQIGPCTGYICYPVLATLHIRSQKRQFSPSNFADAIRLFPPSPQSLACDKKGWIVSITTAFPSVPKCHPPFSRAARFHMLYYWMKVRRYSPLLGAQLTPTVPEPGRKHTERHDDR